MRRPVATTLVVIVSWLPAAPRVIDQRGGPEQEVLTAVAHVRVPSNVFRATRDAYIWLPAGEVVTATRYPVLVFPDAEEKGQFRAALGNIQYLINRQLIPPLIVVGVPYFANRAHELTPRATGNTARGNPDAGGADESLRFIADELLPWVEARYPTVPTRILVGHSLGALFALHAMVTRPQLFRVVIALSTPLWWNDGSLSREWAARIAADTIHPRTLFLASGGLEPDFDASTTAFATRLTALLDSVHAKSLRFERRRYPRDAHEMTPLPGLVDGLRMAFEPLVVPIDSVAGALAGRQSRDSAEIRAIATGLESRYAEAARSLGVPARFPETPLNFLGAYALDSKHPGLAAALLRENRDRYPQSSIAHESLGEALTALGDTTEAVRELRAALAIAKDTLQTTTSIISRTRERRVTAAALEQLRALHRSPPSP